VCCAAVVASAFVGTGCTGTPHRDVVSTAALSFVGRLEAGDGAAACRLLTDDARNSASGATDMPCEKAIASVKENGRRISRVQVWGDAAQVYVAGDVVFLRRISGDWLVSAAGCMPQPPGPYDCKVGG
jgi:hypothetical protein